jgi:hypothetical protein
VDASGSVAKRRRALLAGLAALSCASSPMHGARAQAHGDGHEPLTRIDDQRALSAQVGKHRRPLLLFYSLPGCPFCLEVRRNHLAAYARDGDRGPLIREIDITSRRTFIGLDGNRTTEYAFANANKVRMVPHVVLLDAELKPLGDPMIGIGVSEFYGAYLADAIDSAMRKLQGR